MAGFNTMFQNLNPSFAEMNSSIELLNSLSALENLNSNAEGLVAISNDTFLDHQQPQLSVTFTDNIKSSFHSDCTFYDPVTHFLPSAGGPSHDKSVKTNNLTISSTSISAPGLVADTKTKRNYNFGARKRKRNNEKEVEKPREVIHVRAKRGQATDGHSLAERLRREKINEKLRSLQDLVPGCYKKIGMAVMLDVIINYVRSLQNQIDFLSMKLSAASLFYDFNSEMDPVEAMQWTSGNEAQGMERMVGEGYGGLSHFP